MMKIDIWSDFACPFCYIGKRNLESALKEFDSQDVVELVFHSYQLDPNAKKGGQINPVDELAKKYGTSRERAQEMIDRVVNMAKDVGLNYNYDKLISTNTLDAHRLSHYAKKENKDRELVEELFKAHFIEGLDIGDLEVLAELGARVELDREEIKSILKSEEYYSEVDLDKYTASQYQIRSVPFFIFNNRYAVSGAQPVEAFLETLTKASQ
ncbi:MAG: DsbA family oxidoreductase [Tissierellia bacterium]|jgi:predicted DsbA family dithiol-disulfide isomerase|nr:DsbA family oxidoreductase [Tissierellia bacterium]